MQDESPSLIRPDGELSVRAAALLRLRDRMRSIPPRRILAMAIALAVGTGTWSVTRAAGVERARWGEVVAVLVATDHLEIGEALSAQNSELQNRPLALVPAGSLTELRVGVHTIAPLVPGQTIVEAAVAPDRAGLRGWERAVTIPMPLAPPPLQGGDTVDLIAVRLVAGHPRSITLGHARVLDLDEVGLTLAIDQLAVGSVFEALGSGAVEVARRPTQR